MTQPGKKGNLTISNSMDGHRGCRAECSKSDRDRQVPDVESKTQSKWISRTETDHRSGNSVIMAR